VTAFGVELLRCLLSDGIEVTPTELEFVACERAVGELSRRDYASHQRIIERVCAVLDEALHLPVLTLKQADALEGIVQRLAAIGAARATVVEQSSRSFFGEQWRHVCDDLDALATESRLDALEAEAAELASKLGVPVLTERQEAALEGLRTISSWAATRGKEFVATMDQCAANMMANDVVSAAEVAE
jgi:hypothetical protein